jgi:hypothetical protein
MIAVLDPPDKTLPDQSDEAERVNASHSSLPPTFFTAAKVSGAYAVTDAGTVIPLVRYEAVSILPAGRRLPLRTPEENQQFLAALEQQFLKNTRQDPNALLKLVEPFPSSNCHGWVLTRGEYGVCDTLLLSILADNGYAETEYVEDGDLVVFTHDGQVKHSGIARVDGSGTLFVESKWGPFGVYLHQIDAHPFSKTFKFYRSPRNGHLLTIVRGTGDAGP